MKKLVEKKQAWAGLVRIQEASSGSWLEEMLVVVDLRAGGTLSAACC